MNTSANRYNVIKVKFKEKRIAAKEIMAKEGLTSEKETYNSIRIDYFAVWTLLAGVFVISFDHSAIQSLVFKDSSKYYNFQDKFLFQGLYINDHGPVCMVSLRSTVLREHGYECRCNCVVNFLWCGTSVV